MEISIINNTSIRIKGKQGTLIVNPVLKATGANGIILFDDIPIDKTKADEGIPIIKGPGEYEFAGIKISGIKNGTETIYTIKVDRIEILLGRGKCLEKDHAKVKEHNIVLLYIDDPIDSSFITSLVLNSVLLYGEKAEETMNTIAKDTYRKEIKYSATFDKLPQEIEEVLLQ